ncbi:MAG: aspartate kinase [Armatimonadetes bacterium]|nr:aspartate kinase [Armatimonadota bacterium]
MKVRVMKFGGTSVRTPEARMAAALRVISAKEQGYHPVVVVSAIGRKGEPYATDTLLQLVQGIDPTVKPDARELDMIMAVGEILSSVVFAQTLKSLGHPSMSFRGGQAGIRTDGVYGNARILGVNPQGLMEGLMRGVIPVVCGFQGVWTHGKLPGSELNTLGRGGSDTTAAALGAALRADAVEIYTDVDGVKTADPDFVREAPTLRRVTYDEVAEIAHLGAKVLHPRAAEIAMKFSIPLWVKNTFTDDSGTEIVAGVELPGRRVTGVTHTGKLVYIQIDLADVDPAHRSVFEARVYETLARYHVNMYMTTLTSGGIGFAVPREQFAEVQDMFDALVMPVSTDKTTVYLVQSSDKESKAFATQSQLLSGLDDVRVVKLSVTEGCTMVSVVGKDYIQRPGVYLSVLQTLHDAQIPVLQTSDSDFSLSVLVPESELRRGVALLHEKLTGDA